MRGSACTRRDLDSLRHAFQIDEYPLSGRMTGEFVLKGERGRPIGTGSMTIEDGVAYGEPIQKATASLRFDGPGVRLDAIEIAKGEGTITGAAFIGWDSTYSFNVDGRRIPAGAVAFLSYPGRPLSGTVELSASGNGTFDEPRNDYKFRISDLAVAGETGGPGHRRARAAGHGPERPDRRGVAAAVGDRHRADLARSGGRL